MERNILQYRIWVLILPLQEKVKKEHHLSNNWSAIKGLWAIRRATADFDGNGRRLFCPQIQSGTFQANQLCICLK